MEFGTIRKAVGAAVMGTMIMGSSARAGTLSTAPIQPAEGQKLVCTAVNLSGKSLQITAQIIDRYGDNVTDFIRTDWNQDETVLTTVRAESSNPDARYCRVTVLRGRKAEVAASLQACSWDETTCSDPIVAR
jgi:hypothetical protein